MENTLNDTLVNLDEASAQLKVPKSWFYGHIHAGTLPFPVIKIGRYVRLRQRDISAHIEAQIQRQAAR